MIGVVLEDGSSRLAGLFRAFSLLVFPEVPSNLAEEAVVDVRGSATVMCKTDTKVLLRALSVVPDEVPPAVTPKVRPVPPVATTMGTLVPNVTPGIFIELKSLRDVECPTATTDTRPVTGIVIVVTFMLVPVEHTTSLSSRATDVTLPVFRGLVGDRETAVVAAIARDIAVIL